MFVQHNSNYLNFAFEDATFSGVKSWNRMVIVRGENRRSWEMGRMLDNSKGLECFRGFLTFVRCRFDRWKVLADG